MGRSIFIGFDPREAAAFAVTRHSIRRHLSAPVDIHGIVLDHMRAEGLYWRPTERRNGVLWDIISEAPMSTTFAISRFLTPHLARSGWAVYMDCDMLACVDLVQLFREAEASDKAVLCVQHEHKPVEFAVKMDGQPQLPYARKNWSSLVAYNVDHPANRRLSVKVINGLPGRDLHRFVWLDDASIGSLDPAWNVLVGHGAPPPVPRVLHFTEGIPLMPGYEHSPFADLWLAELNDWAAGQ